jgi:hypothetical protein
LTIREGGMSFWKNLFGGTPSPPPETAWDAIKRAARDNEQQRRRELEQGARASPEEMAARIASLRSIDHVNKSYSEMRHADFCDAISAAVRAGNFSDHDATHALYAREWVSSGGAWRTSFPEWVAAEGRQHFLRLNSEWLRSGEMHTTFNDWLIGVITPKPAPPASPKSAPATPQKPETKLTEWKVTKSPVDDGKWRSQGSGIVCEHDVTGVLEPHTKTSLRIECSVSRWDNGTLATYLRFYLTPYLYLIPDAEPFEARLVKAPFALGLVADGSGLGTEASPLVQGGMFEVNASANEEVPDTAILGIVSSRDTMLAMRTLAVGKDMTFTLIDYEMEPPVRLRLRLTGDRNFASLYERLQRTV